MGNRVERLLQRDGAVVGVRCGGEEIEAGAVVLATGGFHANPSLIARHLPSLAPYGDLVRYNGPASSRGDVFELGEQVGAGVAGRDRYVAMLTPRLEGREFGAYLPGWLLILGPDGRRCFDETMPYGQSYGVARATGEVVYGLFDAQTLADNGTSRLRNIKPRFPTGSEGPPNIWTTDNIVRLLETGAAVEADTLAGVAERLGLPVGAVEGAVQRYNDHAARGEDRDFLKPAEFMRPLVRPLLRSGDPPLHARLWRLRARDRCRRPRADAGVARDPWPVRRRRSRRRGRRYEVPGQRQQLGEVPRLRACRRTLGGTVRPQHKKSRSLVRSVCPASPRGDVIASINDTVAEKAS